MQNIHIQDFDTHYGTLILGSFDDKLCLCDWKYRKMRESVDSRIKKGIGAEYETASSDVIEATKSQLNEYFARKRKVFEIPLLMVGTDFQKEVWKHLIQVPFGKTESYLGLSKRMNNELAIRAVASANGANAISILVPCHRIVGSGGELTGYAGGLSAKQKLLQLEGAGLQMNLW